MGGIEDSTSSSPRSGLKVPCLEAIASDKDRLNALYAPFRPREANPESYDRKLKFWVKAVEEYGDTSNRISFTFQEVKKAFKSEDGRTPACLEEVMTHVCKNGMLVSESDFMENLKGLESWKSWSQISAWRIVKKVVSFVPVPSPISYFYSKTGSADQEETRLVNVEQLKELSKRAVSSDPSLLNKITSVSDWKGSMKNVTKLEDPKDLEYLLKYLQATKRIVMDRVGSEQVLVMTADGTQPRIGEVEKGKYDMVRTKEILENQLSDITLKAKQAEERARASLKQGRRNTAKHELRRKKLLEQRMDKLLTMVDNLSVLQMKIEDAESDAVMISAYEAGKKALAGVLADKRMNADKVTEAMLDIQELLDEHADISSALSQPVDNQAPDDIAELEDELEQLMKEDEKKEQGVVDEKEKERPYQPSPMKFAKPDSTDEEEVEKLLRDLDMNDLEDFSKTLGEQDNMPSPSQSQG